MRTKHNTLDASQLLRSEWSPLLGGTHGSKHETMFQPFLKHHAKANLQLPFGCMLHIAPEAPPFFPIEMHPTLGIFTVIGCMNQSVVNIRQFADASCSGGAPSSMEMVGSSKCCIHRHLRYKIVPNPFVNTRQEYAIHTWTF